MFEHTHSASISSLLFSNTAADCNEIFPSPPLVQAEQNQFSQLSLTRHIHQLADYCGGLCLTCFSESMSVLEQGAQAQTQHSRHGLIRVEWRATFVSLELLPALFLIQHSTCSHYYTVFRNWKPLSHPKDLPSREKNTQVRNILRSQSSGFGNFCCKGYYVKVSSQEGLSQEENLRIQQNMLCNAFPSSLQSATKDTTSINS